ncbi:MAG: hypothetical protein VX378_11240 [Pseudomonadota bacterium]|nr:hypothetical protein [Pseudomonadota bacterium]MEE3071663.1 hypothetical protein [Pseudomonadota bacterium]
MMDAFENLDQQDLIKLLALRGNPGAESDWEDDHDDDEDWDDDESVVDFYDSDDGDDEIFFDAAGDWEDDDDDGEGFGESDLMERRRRRRSRRPRYKRARSRRLRKMKGSNSTVLKSRNGQQMKVRFGTSFAKAEDVNKLITDTEAKFKSALQERKKNFDTLSKQISGVSGSVDKVTKRVKKLESTAQTSQLLSLLSSPPKIETISFDADPGKGEAKVTDVTYKKQDMMLPLLLSGALGDMNGGDNAALLLLALNK